MRCYLPVYQTMLLIDALADAGQIQQPFSPRKYSRAPGYSAVTVYKHPGCHGYTAIMRCRDKPYYKIRTGHAKLAGCYKLNA